MDSIRRVAPGGLGDRTDAGNVRGHYGVAAADGTLHDGDIDDVVVTGLPGQDADLPGEVLAHRLRTTDAEETAQAGLP